MLQRKFDELVKNEFPNAKDAKDTSIHYLGKMQLEHKLDVSKVLMATSVCSDDINVPSTTFFNVLFGPFVMGGLGGIPFVGQTGMTAFAHHIPDEGSAFIFYGPHIGITPDGELGKMYRPRMEQTGNSCGALMLALNRFQELHQVCDAWCTFIDENTHPFQATTQPCSPKDPGEVTVL